MDVDEYAKHKAQAWDQFYLASPGDCRRWQVIALKELTEQNGLV
jgi:phosphorylase kinase alpha/beta subunit